jgi:hypothetical protein
MKRFSHTTEVDDPELRGPAIGRADAAGKICALRNARSGFEVTHDAYIRMLAKFSDTFDSQLGGFLERLWTDSYRCIMYFYKIIYNRPNSVIYNIRYKR